MDVTGNSFIKQWVFTHWKLKFNFLNCNIAETRLYVLLKIVRVAITTTTVLQPFVRGYPGEPVPEETFTHSPVMIIIQPLSSFFHLLRSIASSLFNLRAWQSFCTTSFQVLFGLPLGLESSTFMHFFTLSVSSFRNTCPYYCSLFCCSTKIISSISNLSLSQLFTWDLYLLL